MDDAGQPSGHPGRPFSAPFRSSFPHHRHHGCGTINGKPGFPRRFDMVRKDLLLSVAPGSGRNPVIQSRLTDADDFGMLRQIDQP